MLKDVAEMRVLAHDKTLDEGRSEAGMAVVISAITERTSCVKRISVTVTHLELIVPIQPPQLSRPLFQKALKYPLS